MPKLRRFGNALQASGDALQQIALRMYQKQLDDEQARERFAHQKQLQDEQQGSSQLITLAQNPDVARRLAQAGQKFGQVDPTPFAPSQEEIVGEVGTKIGETTRENLPGDLLIEAQLAGKGVDKDPRPIEQLMAIRQERERRLSDEELRQLRESERIDPTTGVKVKGPEGNTIALERTGEQEGARKQAELLGGELSQPVSAANARKAGAQSYASSSGSTRGTMDVEFGNLPKVKAIADAKRGPGDDQGPIQARENSAKGMLQTLRALSSEVNTQGGTRQLLEGGLKWAGTFINADNVDLMFKSIKRPLGLTLAVVIQGSRPTDRDAALFEDILPGFTTPKPVADALIEEVEKLLNESGVAAQDINAILNARPGTPIPNITPIPNALERLIQAKKRGEGMDTGSIIDWVPGMRRPQRMGGPGRSGGPGGM